MAKHFFTLFFIITLFGLNLKGQDFLESARITGNFQIDAQYYMKDTLIGALDKDFPEKVLSNGFLFLNLSMKNFSAGIRYENYLNPILGIDKGYTGQGISYRFAEFTSEIFDVTAGNYYEQFGSGMIFRTYEERQLGLDNAMDGLRFRLRPLKGIELTGIIGKQRIFWNTGDGIVRGGDLVLNINELDEELLPKGMRLNLGGSVVGKYQQDKETSYNLPENVFAYSTRLSFGVPDFNMDAEFAYKYNDPCATNEIQPGGTANFNPGTGFLMSASYFPAGLGVTLNVHRFDNMDFRSDRTALNNNLMINFLPPLTKQHAYALAGIYPYATQPNGEVGLQGEFTYTFPKNTFFGGEYGTTVTLNFSRVNSLDTTHILTTTQVNDTTSRTDVFTYDSPFFSIGKRIYFQDINIEITKKWSKSLKSIFEVLNLIYDRDIIEHGGAPEDGKVYATAATADLTYNISKTNAIRTEIAHLWAKQDSLVEEGDYTNGNWFMLLGEYTIAPSWYFSVLDQYNYGNDNENLRLHYLTASIAFIHEATRVSFGYGRQREGILCVGGVCRRVPASNGFFLSITSTF